MFKVDNIKLFLSYVSMHIKVSLEYKISFILTVISQLLSVLLELFAVIALFSKFQLLEEYNPYEILFSFSIIWLGYSIAETFVRGFDHFGELIKKGNFDLLLVRPRNIFLQILGFKISIEKVSRILVALGILIYSSLKIIKTINIFKILLLFNMFIGSIIIFSAIFIIGASFAFVTIEGLEIINIFTNGTRQLTQYPLGIYNKIIRIILTIIIPVTIISYYPLDYLLDKTSNISYVFLPLLSFIPLTLSILVFKQGIKKYNSTGS